jgi:hypothetical protein
MPALVDIRFWTEVPPARKPLEKAADAVNPRGFRRVLLVPRVAGD